jgi:hypothetical protein
MALERRPSFPNCRRCIPLVMANFKRKGPKSTRAGCLLCKPQKRQGQRLALRVGFSERRRLEAANSDLRTSK